MEIGKVETLTITCSAFLPDVNNAKLDGIDLLVELDYSAKRTLMETALSFLSFDNCYLIKFKRSEHSDDYSCSIQLEYTLNIYRDA